MKYSIKYWFYKLRFVLAFTVFLICSGTIGEYSWINRFRQWNEISSLRQEIDDYTRKFEQDKKTLDALKHDPAAVRDVARSRYYMKTENEDIFIVEDDEEDD